MSLSGIISVPKLKKMKLSKQKDGENIQRVFTPQHTPKKFSKEKNPHLFHSPQITRNFTSRLQGIKEAKYKLKYTDNLSGFKQREGIETKASMHSEYWKAIQPMSSKNIVLNRGTPECEIFGNPKTEEAKNFRERIKGHKILSQFGQVGNRLQLKSGTAGERRCRNHSEPKYEKCSELIGLPIRNVIKVLNNENKRSEFPINEYNNGNNIINKRKEIRGRSFSASRMKLDITKEEKKERKPCFMKWSNKKLKALIKIDDVLSDSELVLDLKPNISPSVRINSYVSPRNLNCLKKPSPEKFEELKKENKQRGNRSFSEEISSQYMEIEYFDTALTNKMKSTQEDNYSTTIFNKQKELSKPQFMLKKITRNNVLHKYPSESKAVGRYGVDHKLESAHSTRIKSILKLRNNSVDK